MHTSCLHAKFSRHKVVIEAFPHLSPITLCSFAAWEDRENGRGRGKQERQQGKGGKEADGGRMDGETGVEGEDKDAIRKKVNSRNKITVGNPAHPSEHRT